VQEDLVDQNSLITYITAKSDDSCRLVDKKLGLQLHKV